jgi:hypothetical protein
MTKEKGEVSRMENRIPSKFWIYKVLPDSPVSRW